MCDYYRIDKTAQRKGGPTKSAQNQRRKQNSSLLQKKDKFQGRTEDHNPAHFLAIPKTILRSSVYHFFLFPVFQEGLLNYFSMPPEERDSSHHVAWNAYLGYYFSIGIKLIDSVLTMFVNLVAILILSRGKCGLSKCITRYLVGMAVADLLVVSTDPILRRILLIYFPYSFLSITPICSLIKFLIFASTMISVWLTVAFTFDRFVTIRCEKLKAKYCTERTAAVVIGTVSVLCSLESIPWYFIYEPEYIIDTVPWGCVPKQSYYVSPAWTGFVLFHRILTPCVPFFLILLLNALTVKRILAASRGRRRLRGICSGEIRNDPEMENRKKSIILLFSISGSFILLWATQVVFYINQRITKQYPSSTNGPLYITQSTAAMLQLLSSCSNTCIYAVTQTKFREELKKVVKYPLNLIVKLVKS
ncbi:probable G-protein coupled receptor 139 [Heterodontus francisci]|uniref:probable G-protein coupled receptor 139 n=1 Tax=Heterodontus francisci TaxID=7792 RepID=UPI00355B7993